jgi:uncharacterized protein HemX
MGLLQLLIILDNHQGTMSRPAWFLVIALAVAVVVYLIVQFRHVAGSRV